MASLGKVLSDPLRYLRLAFGALPLQLGSRLLQNSSFFLQAQMDIHPKARWRTDLNKVTGGFYPDHKPRRIQNLSPWDNVRRDMLILLLRDIVERDIPGDMAEVGVYRGLTARLFHHYIPERSLHLFDTFEGFTDRSALEEARSTGDQIRVAQFSDTSLERVQRFIDQQNNNVRYYRGFFPDTIPDDLHDKAFSFVHLDADLYEPILAGLNFFYPRMSKGGVIVVHDYHSWLGAHQAVMEFSRGIPERPISMPDKNGSALIVRSLS